MEFNQFKDELKKANLEAVRTDEADYFEAVFVKAELAPLTIIIEKIFGVPVFPSSSKIPAEAVKAAEKFGGVRGGQTLYFSKKDSNLFFCMFWPWQDRQHITLKTGRA